MRHLHFSVRDAQAKPHTAVPTIAFALRIASQEGIEALVLHAQLRIEPQWREYEGTEKTLLNELFGTPDRWQTTLRTFSWADVPVMVPAFEKETIVEVAIPCTYDFDIAAAKYLNALGGGLIPVRFLFSGAIFRRTPSFSSERVSWASECAYRLPYEVWKEAMRACYGDDALIRIKHETFERLLEYRALSGASSWDDVILQLVQT